MQISGIRQGLPISGLGFQEWDSDDGDDDHPRDDVERKRRWKWKFPPNPWEEKKWRRDLGRPEKIVSWFNSLFQTQEKRRRRRRNPLFAEEKIDGVVKSAHFIQHSLYCTHIYHCIASTTFVVMMLYVTTT